MRARAVAGGIVASAAVLAVGWQVGAGQVAASQATASAPGASSSSGSAGSGTSGSGSTSSGSSSTSSPSATSTPSTSAGSSSGSTSKAVSGTFTGTTAETQFGPMQVAVVVSNGKITDVKTLQETNQGGRSVEISNEAVPILRSEVLSAQSADIQSVSGATYTSEGYVTSLQSALDKAGL